MPRSTAPCHGRVQIKYTTTGNVLCSVAQIQKKRGCVYLVQQQHCRFPIKEIRRVFLIFISGRPETPVRCLFRFYKRPFLLFLLLYLLWATYEKMPKSLVNFPLRHQILTKPWVSRPLKRVSIQQQQKKKLSKFAKKPLFRGEVLTSAPLFLNSHRSGIFSPRSRKAFQ